MGFGPSSKFPTMGMVPPSRFAPMGMVQDPEEMAMMMGAQNRPRVAQHAQPGPMPLQASASPIRAPKDKAMGFLGKFGRILAGGAYGGENMGWIERLGRGPEGMNAVRDEIRAGKKAAEEEARRQQVMAQLGLSPQEMAFAQAFPEQAGEVFGGRFKPAAAAKYGLDLKEVTDPVTGEKRLVQASEAGGVRPVEGFVPAPPAPDQRPWWALDGGGVDPAQLANQEAGRAGGVTVNNNLPSEKGETKFQEGLGSQAATNFQTVVDQGKAAGAAIGNLDTMETLLDNIDYTGFGGDTLLQVQRAGAMLGIEIEDLPAKEAANRLSKQMALSLKTDLPGPMSNADREFLLSIPPNLNSTAAGNDAILFILRKREERKQDMMQSLLQANPQSMEEMRAWENQYLQTTPPMFTTATQASLLKALGGAAQ